MRWVGLTVSLFLVQTQIKLARLMQYRVDFAIGLAVSLGFTGMAPLFQLMIYSRTRGFPGWDLDQILVFQGVLLLASSLREVLFGDVRQQIDQLMEKGEFDRLLLKPYPPLLHILTGGFSPYALGTVTVGVATLFWAGWRSEIRPGPVAVALFLVFLCAGILLSLSASILYCTLTLRWTYPMRLNESIDKVLRFGDFPSEVFPVVLRTLFLTFLPLSVAAYWPAQALLGRVGAAGVVATASTVVLWLFMVWCWQRQLHRYESAGG